MHMCINVRYIYHIYRLLSYCKAKSISKATNNNNNNNANIIL